MRQAAEQRADQFADQLDQLRSQQEAVAGKHEDQLAECQLLLEQAEQRASDAATELELLKSDHQVALDAVQGRLDESEQKREAAERRVQEVAAKLDALESDHDAELENQQALLMRREADRDAAQRRVDEISAELQSLRAEQAEELERQQTRFEESESRRQEAENRIEEMTSKLEALESDQDAALESQQAKLAESESIAEQLRRQVEDLQKTVAEAQQEAAQLRADFEQSSETVRELQQLLSQRDDQDDKADARWETEAEELRQTVEQLSQDLQRASEELSELRGANESLTERLESLREERDELRDDFESRPTDEQLRSLQEQLEEANEQLAAMQKVHEETLESIRNEAAAVASVEPQHPETDGDGEPSLEADVQPDWSDADRPEPSGNTLAWDSSELEAVTDTDSDGDSPWGQAESPTVDDDESALVGQDEQQHTAALPPASPWGADDGDSSAVDESAGAVTQAIGDSFWREAEGDQDSEAVAAEEPAFQDESNVESTTPFSSVVEDTEEGTDPVQLDDTPALADAAFEQPQLDEPPVAEDDLADSSWGVTEVAETTPADEATGVTSPWVAADALQDAEEEDPIWGSDSSAIDEPSGVEATSPWDMPEEDSLPLDQQSACTG